MVKPEYSYERDLSYSQWHRTLLPSCYALNLDWVEIRRNKDGGTQIVALLEEKDDRAKPLNEWRKSIFLQIAKALNIPAYIVYHNACRRPDHKHLWKFRVQRLSDNDERVLDEPEYRKWLQSL